jgi:predicted DNA-binding transcriptional regulator YafY
MRNSSVRLPKPTPRPLDRYAVPRRLDLEAALRRAIQKRVRVKFSYEQERHLRLFEPYAIFRDVDCLMHVYGWQVRNPAQPNEPSRLAHFEIGRIGALALTHATMTSSATFRRTHVQGARDIICSI